MTNYVCIWTPYSNDEATFWQGHEFWETPLSNPVSRAMVESAEAVFCITHGCPSPQSLLCARESGNEGGARPELCELPWDPARPLWERRRAVQVLAIYRGHMPGLGRELTSTDAKALGPALFQSQTQPCSTGIPERYKTIRLCPLSLRFKVIYTPCITHSFHTPCTSQGSVHAHQISHIYHIYI